MRRREVDKDRQTDRQMRRREVNIDKHSDEEKGGRYTHRHTDGGRGRKI